MTDPTTVEAQTNTTPNSCVDVKCDCSTMWSMAQQFSYLRLSDEVAPFKSKLIKDYSVRARRIAASYARFYLEQEDGGDMAKKGRFYWMALGAFASKTVACTLDTWQLDVPVVSKTTKEGLGKGNFWLFCEISGWHWYYCKYPKTFDMCLESRNADNYNAAVKAQVKKLPWSAEALPKIKNLAVSSYIKSGFAKVKEFEQEVDATEKRNHQFNHLLAIADHEQGVILQPLIYDDQDFAYWVRFQRTTLGTLGSPTVQLMFSHACGTDTEALRSAPPKDTKLEEFRSRMKWIGKAAEQFHKLMGERRGYMEGELATMAGWVAMADR